MKIKHALSSLLATTLALSLVACGGQGAASSEAVSKADSTSLSVSTAPAAAENSGEVNMANLNGLTVGYSQCDNASAWRITETESMIEVAEQNGVNLITSDAQADIAKQASDIEDLIAQGVDYLLVSPQEEDGLQNALEEAMSQGIKVVLVDRSIKGDVGTNFATQIMSDYIWEAEQAAKKVIEVTGGKGNVVILQGTPGSTAAKDRQIGFMNTIADTDLEIIADQPAAFLMAEAQQVMENILQAKGDEIDVVFCHNDDMALGALAAIKAAGYVPGEDIQVVGIDGAAAAMEAILAGEMLATVSCNPRFGPIAFETLSRLEAGDAVEETIVIEDELFDIANADPTLGF